MVYVLTVIFGTTGEVASGQALSCAAKASSAR